MADKVSCAIAMFLNYAKRQGSKFNDALVMKELKDPHAKAVYANADSRYTSSVAEAGLKENPSQQPNFFQQAGVQLKDLVGYTLDGDSIIGKEAVEELNKVFTDYLTNAGKGNKQVWDAKYRSQVEALEAKYSKSGNPLFNHIKSKYWDAQKRGGQIEGLVAAQNPFSIAGRNAVGNLVGWNPLITSLNAFEYTPKALAYATEQGNPLAILKGLATALHDTGGNIFKQSEALKAKGVYGFNDERWNLLHLTENPLRTLSYHLGEAVAPGKGMEALEKVAFVSRLGNEPLIFLDHSGTDTLALMRYSLASTKMYLRLWNGVRKGNLNAAAALIAWSAVQAVQTGGASAIPFYGIVPDEWKQAVKDFDEATGFNWASKYLHTDFSKYTQPLNPPALGAGLAIASQDIKGSVSALQKGTLAAEQGEPAIAASEFLSAAFGFGQLFKIPGVNLTTKRAVDVLADVAANDFQAEPEEVLQDFGEKTKLLNPTGE